MSEHGILFSAPMVRAILADRKTQTRRVVSPRNSLVNGDSPCMKRDPDIISAWPNLDFGDVFVDPGPSPMGNAGPYLRVAGADGSRHRVYPRVQPGDRLWVRETWRTEERSTDGADGIRFIADNAFCPIGPTTAVADWIDSHARAKGGWRSSRFMPRWAARITLHVTAVRPERLQHISESDAEREGVDGPSCSDEAYGWYPSGAFRDLWDSINGKRSGCSWADNPWVWTITFKRLDLDRAPAQALSEVQP